MNWTDEKNLKRCKLIEKEIDGNITPDEAKELKKLQKEMITWRQEVAPLPFVDFEIIRQQITGDTMPIAENLQEAESFFLKNSSESVKCIKRDGSEKVCECYPDAAEFFKE